MLEKVPMSTDDTTAPEAPAGPGPQDASAGERAGKPAWAPLARSSTHELVIAQIEDRIMSGDLVVGDALPPEREFAATLGVSRAGVREAIRVLEGQGVLRSGVGSGKSAGTFVAALPSQALMRFLRLHVALSNFRIDEVVEARVLLERASAELAARRADADALARMRGALAVMQSPGLTREAFNEADTEFHIAIAQAGGNRLFADMTGAIRESLRAEILRGFRQVDDWDSLAAMLVEQHEAIFREIESGDRDHTLADTMEKHIRSAAEALPYLSATDRE